MRLKHIILVLVILFSSFAYSFEPEELLYSNHVKTHLTIDGGFDIVKTKNNYKVDYVTVKLSYLPLESYRQRVITHITNPIGEEYADYILFTWEKPPIGSESFSSEYIVSTGSNFFPIKNKVDFPLNNLNNDLLKYTQETKLIDLNDDIYAVANEIAQGRDDLFDVVFSAAVWVNENIEYELSTVNAEASLPSSTVIRTRNGVCDEMTNLFISILRGLGIPARFVSGISYTNSPLFDEPWGPHGWAEVYFPGEGWVPFDPTYGQYGFVDSGHIKLKESVDSDKSSIDYEWLSYGVDVVGMAPNNDVEVLEIGGRISTGVDINIRPLVENVGFGSYNVIVADLTNNLDEYRALKLEIGPTQGIQIFEKSKYAFMEPKSSKTVAWKIKFPTDLDPRSIYTFPIVVYDNFGKSFETKVFVEKREVDLEEDYVNDFITGFMEVKKVLDVDFSCKYDNYLKEGKTTNIECSIVDYYGLNACFENKCISLTSNKFNYTKTYESAGVYPLRVTVTDNVDNKDFIGKVFVYDKPSVNLEWDNITSNISYSNSEKFSFFVEPNSVSIPRNVVVNMNYNNLVRSVKVGDLENSQIINSVIKGEELNVGDNIVKVIITYQDDSGNEYNQEFNTEVFMYTNSAGETIFAKINTFFNWLFSLFSFANI